MKTRRTGRPVVANVGQGQKKRQTDGPRDGPTDGLTDGWTNGRTDGWTDGRTDPLIEMRGRI